MVKADAMEDAGGVPNTTVAVLLILTLLVSVIGTWSVLRDAGSAQREEKTEGSGAGALVGAGPSIDGIHNAQKTGQVVLDVQGESDE